MSGTSLSSSAIVLAPLFILACTALCLLIFDRRAAPSKFWPWATLTSLILAAVLTFIVHASGQGGPIQGVLNEDGLNIPFVLFFCAAGGAAVLTGLGAEEGAGGLHGGGHALILLAVTGALVVAKSTHLLSMALGLALLYVASTGLVGPRAAYHYGIVHGTGLATFLFGMSLLYGGASTLRLDVMAEKLGREAALGAVNPWATLGALLIVGGLALSLGLVPLHTWLYDTYRQVPAPSGVLVSLVLPAAVTAALSRLVQAWPEPPHWLLAIPGAAGVLLGYGHALRSWRVRDALAGVAAAQSGLLFLAWNTAPAAGWGPLFHTLMANGLSLSCFWALVVNARHPDNRPLVLGDIAGLGRRRPWMAAALTLCLLNLAGAPLLAGWAGQLYVVRTALTAGYPWVIAPFAAWALLAWLLAGKWMSAIWLQLPGERAWLRTAPEIAVVALAAAGGALLGGIYAAPIWAWIASLAIGPW
jgi:NADH-quinone oxidoreductase subunit N